MFIFLHHGSVWIAQHGFRILACSHLDIKELCLFVHAVPVSYEFCDIAIQERKQARVFARGYGMERLHV